MKAALVRLGIRGFNPMLKRASTRLDGLRTPEGEPIPPNALAELRRDMERRRLVNNQIRQIEEERLKRIEQAPCDGPHVMVRAEPRGVVVPSVCVTLRHSFKVTAIEVNDTSWHAYSLTIGATTLLAWRGGLAIASRRISRRAIYSWMSTRCSRGLTLSSNSTSRLQNVTFCSPSSDQVGLTQLTKRGTVNLICREISFASNSHVHSRERFPSSPCWSMAQQCPARTTFRTISSP